MAWQSHHLSMLQQRQPSLQRQVAALTAPCNLQRTWVSHNMKKQGRKAVQHRVRKQSSSLQPRHPRQHKHKHPPVATAQRQQMAPVEAAQRAASWRKSRLARRTCAQRGGSTRTLTPCRWRRSGASAACASPPLTPPSTSTSPRCVRYGAMACQVLHRQITCLVLVRMAHMRFLAWQHSLTKRSCCAPLACFRQQRRPLPRGLRAPHAARITTTTTTRGHGVQAEQQRQVTAQAAAAKQARSKVHKVEADHAQRLAALAKEAGQAERAAQVLLPCAADCCNASSCHWRRVTVCK